MPRKHADVATIIEEARKGNSFFVNRCAANGDLAGLPEEQQRRIVATANDMAASYAADCVIPLSPEMGARQEEFVAKKLNIAWRIFSRDGGKPLIQQIRELTDSE